jgi:hypothetical protein
MTLDQWAQISSIISAAFAVLSFLALGTLTFFITQINKNTKNSTNNKNNLNGATFQGAVTIQNTTTTTNIDESKYGK